jgi:hypothetical protein
MALNNPMTSPIVHGMTVDDIGELEQRDYCLAVICYLSGQGFVLE